LDLAGMTFHTRDLGPSTDLIDSSFLTRQQYVVSPDGQRFLMNAATGAIDPPSITLMLNWKGTP